MKKIKVKDLKPGMVVVGCQEELGGPVRRYPDRNRRYTVVTVKVTGDTCTVRVDDDTDSVECPAEQVVLVQ